MPPWIKIGCDWHVFDSGVVCYELPERWTDHLSQLAVETDEDVPDLAAQWIIRATSYVLHIHYTCHLTNRLSWPEEIPTWPHGSKGSELYISEKRCKASATKRRNQ